MTETLRGAGPTTGVTIRPYRPTDHSACRRLWGELAEHNRRLYQDSQVSGPDPGAGFEEYLTQLNLSGIWVADHVDDGVVGLVGLLLMGRSGEVVPVAVTPARREQGIGQSLLTRVAEEARRRGLARLTTRPAARDLVAVRTAHSAGFDRMESVTISIALTEPSRSVDKRGGAELDVFDLHFRI